VLPRTRRQPTSRNAGSQTRLNRSSNRHVRPSVAHRCSLVWIPSTRASASSTGSLGHGAPVFTGVLLACQHHRCGLAVPLRHAPSHARRVAGFPGLRLLRGLRPLPGPAADDGPAHRRPGWPAGRATLGGFPRSPSTGRRGRCPALPRQPRHRYTAALPRGLQHRGNCAVLESTTRQQGGRALLPGPHPPGWSRCLPLAGVPPLVHCALHLLVLLAGPGPSGGADPPRRCQGCSHPPLRLRGQAALSFSGLLRQTTGGLLPPARSDGASWRTTPSAQQYT
jgi:hypothetical protein